VTLSLCIKLKDQKVDFLNLKKKCRSFQKEEKKFRNGSAIYILMWHSKIHISSIISAFTDSNLM
jgi:hypothetical protein